ncbi:twitch domain-containing radical SAM protein [Candidatus Pacearchaeota archaeon]|nr:twitch domain-containing radical SAM protein [Candidatus Pacearchaeota archaeon]
MLNRELLAEYNQIRDTKHKEVFCHAPFTAMNFEQNGNVSACCYNRTHILGHYPDNTLQEMWNGEKAGQMRMQMQKNDLPEGCEICYSNFVAKNFSGLKTLFYDNFAVDYSGNEDALPMPKVLEFEISNTCNLECIMCDGYYSSSIRQNIEKKSPLENPYDDSFIEQLEPFIPHLQEARFLGGEPFLIETYYKIWALIGKVNPNINIVVTTNGTILNNRVKEILEKLNVSLVLSIDSLAEQNYERIRVKAKFKKTMENLQYFVDYARRKETDLNFAICPMQHNWKDIPDLLSFCNKNGICLYFNTVFKPVRFSIRTMKNDELFEVIQYLKKTPLTEETEVHQYNNSKYLALINQLSEYDCPEFFNVDAQEEYDHLVKLFEVQYKLDENDAINHLINNTALDILKRLANQKFLGSVNYEPETLISKYDKTYYHYDLNIFLANDKITEKFETLLKATGTKQFIKKYFNLLKLICYILKESGYEISNDLFTKIDDVSRSFISLPNKELVVQEVIKADLAFIVQFFKDFSSDEIIEITNERFK